MSYYFFVPGMMHPWWGSHVQKDYPKPGENTIIFHNKDADTDMGDLSGGEFREMFPTAIEVSEEEFTSGQLHLPRG